MKTHVYEQWKVDQFLNTVPEAAATFRTYHIDPSHLAFANAAAIVSASTDEVLAVMESRMRQVARYAAHVRAQKEEDVFAI